MTRPRKNPCASGIRTRDLLLSRRMPFTTRSRRRSFGTIPPQQHGSGSEGRVCPHGCWCCHTETEAANQACCLIRSRHLTDTEPTSPSTDPLTPGAWKGSLKSSNCQVTGRTRPTKPPTGKAGFDPETDTWPTRPSTDPIAPRKGSLKSTNYGVTGRAPPAISPRGKARFDPETDTRPTRTRPAKPPPGKAGFDPETAPLGADALPLGRRGGERQRHC